MAGAPPYINGDGGRALRSVASIRWMGFETDRLRTQNYRCLFRRFVQLGRGSCALHDDSSLVSYARDARGRNHDHRSSFLLLRETATDDSGRRLVDVITEDTSTTPGKTIRRTSTTRLEEDRSDSTFSLELFPPISSRSFGCFLPVCPRHFTALVVC